MQPVNPYVAGASLRGEDGFFGRQDTLDWVVQELRNPTTNALVLFGQRRIGKTTLLLRLEHILPTEGFLPVYFDLHDQAARPLGQVLADLSDTISEQANLGPVIPDTFDNQGRFFSRTFLPRVYQALQEDCRPVFLLDEFDVLGQAAEAELPSTVAAKALFPFLRKVMSEDSRPAFVFVVGRRAQDLSLDFSAIFKASLEREVWVLDPESAEMLVRQAETNGTLRFTEQSVTHILSLTNCHPYLTQLLCQRIWERAWVGNPTTPPLIDRMEVEAILPDVLETGNQALTWLWNGLSPAEKIYAAALAEIADGEETIPEDRVIQVLTTHAARLRRREVELAPQDLVQRRVLERVGDKKYRFAVELFCRWVRRNRPLQEVKDELDRIEPFADRLYEIGKDCFKRGKWEKAIGYFRDALERDSQHFRARLHLGEALLKQDQTKEAVAELEIAHELDRDEAQYALARALVIQARAQAEVGDAEGALMACKRALAISPNEQAAQEIFTAIWTRRGDAALGRNDLEAALAAYREAGDAEKIARVEARRRTLAALETEAQAHERAKRWAQAIEALKRIAGMDPTYKDAQARLGQAQVQYELQNLYERAVANFQEGRWAQAIEGLEAILRQVPDYLDAAEKLEEAQRLQGRAAREHQELATLYSAGMKSLERRSWEEAATTFRRLITVDPEYEDAWQRLDEAKENARRFQNLEDLYRASKAHLEKEQWGAGIVYLKRIADSGEKYRDAAALLEEAETKLELQTLSARVAAQLREELWAEAIETLEKIVRIDPSYEDSGAELARARTQYRLQNLYERATDHFQEERWAQAIGKLETILREDPSYPGATDKLNEAREEQELATLYSAGVGLLAIGRWEDAIEKFREIILRVGVYKRVADRLVDAQRQKKLDQLFKQGTDHLHLGRWAEAARYFEEVKAIEPDYRNVQMRLEDARRQLRLEELRKRGEASLRTENWQEAVDIFKELHDLEPQDGSAIKLEEAKRQLELDEIYCEGIEHFQRKRWRKAEGAFEKVLHLAAEYRDAAAKLEATQEHLSRRNHVAEVLRDPIMQGIGVIIALIALMITMSPSLKGALFSRIFSSLMPKPAELCNGDFEANFECWQHGGELDQSVECNGAQCHAVLGNPDYSCYGGVPVGEAWIRQELKVPQTISPTLSLRYRVFSYDLDLSEYDYFQVAINGEPLPQRYGNYEWNEPTCEGLPWDSDWQSLKIPLGDHQGEEIEVSFHNVNGTNPHYNTWTYIDDVRIGEDY